MTNSTIRSCVRSLWRGANSPFRCRTNCSALADLIETTRFPHLTSRLEFALDAGSWLTTHSKSGSLSMKVSNRFNFPQPLLKLLDRQKYSRGKSDISVTELISPPQIAVLKRVHGHKVQEDISDRFWSIMGTNIHKILEDAADDQHLTEERLFMEVDGWVVSGQIDLQLHDNTSATISDWKFTSVYNVMYPKKEWETQLNLYAGLVEHIKGIPVDKAQVVALLRDWKKSDATRGSDSKPPYPQAPVCMVEADLWPQADRMAFLRERVALHQSAVRSYDWGGELPECTDEDRWRRPTGRRAGVPIRCEENYCGVAEFCGQNRTGKPRAPAPTTGAVKNTRVKANNGDGSG